MAGGRNRVVSGKAETIKSLAALVLAPAIPASATAGQPNAESP